MIKNLVFDFGKVLVNHDLQPVLDRYFGDSTDDKSRFAEILSDRGFIDDCDRGFIPFDEMIESSAAKWPEFADALLFFRDNYLDEITGEINGMRELLVRLKEEGFRLYGLTNWSDTIYRVMERYDIFKMLDGYVISCEEHVIKAIERNLSASLRAIWSRTRRVPVYRRPRRQRRWCPRSRHGCRSLHHCRAV